MSEQHQHNLNVALRRLEERLRLIARDEDKQPIVSAHFCIDWLGDVRSALYDLGIATDESEPQR